MAAHSSQNLCVSVEGFVYIDRARRMQVRTAIGHYEVDALPFVHREFTDRGEIFAGERGLGAKNHKVRAGDGADSAIAARDPGHGRSVVEAYGQLHLYRRASANSLHDAYDVRGVVGGANRA